MGLGMSGLIPAHAGKTEKMVLMPSHTPAHPRSRGENTGAPSGRVYPPGSSPLTRGKPQREPARPGDNGLIPAHAGKTIRSWRSRLRSRAHPRSRGENVVRPGALILEPGSSPLTRGKRTTCRSVRRSRGLIPAHAGKTSTALSHSRR